MIYKCVFIFVCSMKIYVLHLVKAVFFMVFYICNLLHVLIICFTYVIILRW